MKNNKLKKLLKKNKANAGFTLTELLVGLFMSIFVIGALGFGLMQVLGLNQSEGSKTAARNETGRALDFISDELRRAQAIEVDMSEANIFSGANAVAPGYNGKLPTGGTVVLALQIPGLQIPGVEEQRVIYSVAPPEADSPWKGPLVIYRWGPELTANGSYSPTSLANPDGWTNEALIDKIDDTPQTQTCGGTSETYQGFFACVVDDDGDGITEDLTDTNGDGEINSDDTGATDKNGDGVINNEDGADVDGQTITAQLFFTGETITVSGQDTDSYSANTQTVARARTAPENNSEDLVSAPWSFEGLGGNYNCKSGTSWDMQTDFDNSDDGSNKTTWIQERDRNKQAQPITINSDQPLKITSTPVNATDCTSKSDPIEHEIDFGNPITFNGDCSATNSADCTAYNNKPRVKGDTDETVQFFKKGYQVPVYGGYDGGTTNTSDDQPSLGKFLYTKGLAIPLGGGDPNDPNTIFKIPSSSDELTSFLNASSLTPAQKKIFKLLGDDQRIIAFEMGQLYSDKNNDGSAITGGRNPGFDLQDNIFVVTSSVFKKKFQHTCFGGNGCT
jgi:hypothetical protein